MEGNPLLEFGVTSTASACTSSAPSCDSDERLDFIKFGAHKSLKVVIVVSHVFHGPFLESSLSFVCLFLHLQALLFKDQLSWRLAQRVGPR